jgi:hypothetical protein
MKLLEAGFDEKTEIRKKRKREQNQTILMKKNVIN